MNKVVTRIQLVDGPVLGYLDVKEETKLPINFKIGDVRDLSSRSGSFTKLITLAGTKNNNLLLNNYFDVNVKAGTFDINKRQKCIIIQNDVVVLDNAFLRLLSVSKIQSMGQEIDNYVEYQVQVRDSLGDFFKEINNKELTELRGFEAFDHDYTKENVANSFSHTYEDGYKYLLPWIENNDYAITDLMPGIYALQYWEKIHQQAGYVYQWDELSGITTQFDKMIIPYGGDRKKLSEEFRDSVRVIAENVGITQTALANSAGAGNVPFFIPSVSVELSNELVDPQNFYNPSISRYLNSFATFTPNSIDWEVSINFDLVMVNQESVGVIMPLGALAEFSPRLRVLNNNNTGGGTTNLQFTSISNNATAQLFGTLTNGNETLTLTSTVASFSVGETNCANGNLTLTVSATNLAIGQELRLVIDALQDGNTNVFINPFNGAPANMFAKLRVNTCRVSIVPNFENGLVPDGPVFMNSLVPRKIKQSDFIKSIYQKYNLFAEIDPQNPNRIIYTSRDKYYDDGVLKDWTFLKDKQQEQTIEFVPEISSKKLILSYKDDDSDIYLKAYKDETLETYGQVEIEFDNENVKGIERKEEIFSPTINLTTFFGANVPLLNYDFKFNIRFLRDGGERPCGEYTITEYPGSFLTLTTFPFLSMLDEVTNPSFDISYAQPDYYAYNIINGTENNLYTSHWRRTLAQINSGRLLTAYFYLTEEDINKLKLSDKIKVDNALYYINAIIDYDANAKRPTKVELLSVEDDLRLPRFGRIIKPVEPGLPVVTPAPVKPVGPIRPALDAVSQLIRLRNSHSGLVGFTGAFVQGKNNIVPSGFKGIVLADNVNAKQNNALYLGNVRIDEDGNIDYIRGIIIDGGVDVVFPFNKTNPTDILDGTVDAIRNVGGFKQNRPIIDTNIID